MFLQQLYRTSLLFLVFTLYYPLSLFAAQVSFNWQPNSEASLAGYKIHYGTTSRNYTTTVDVGAPIPVDGRIHATIANIVESETLYFAATAYDTDGFNSEYSEELVYVQSEPDTTAQPPTATDITINGEEDTLTIATFETNNPSGSPLQYAITTGPEYGTLTVEDQNHTFTYRPATDFNGSDSFVFTATNENGTSEPATVNLIIQAVNDKPAAHDTAFTIDEDISFNGQLNGTDNDSDTISYTLTTPPNIGTVLISTNGSFTYTAHANANGTDAFTFKVNDGSLDSENATVAVTIQPVNDQPTAIDTAFTLKESTSYNGQLNGTDIDGDTLRYSLDTAPTKGSATITPNGSFTYTAHANANGTDAFTFKVNDDSLDSENATVAVTIQPVNDQPVALDNSFTVEQDAIYNGQLTALDADNDRLSYTLITTPYQGTIHLKPDGSFAYTAPADGHGSDSFTFSVNDGKATSNQATVTIIISPSAKGLQLELGEIEVTSEWQHISFSKSFSDPAVVVKATSINDPDPGEIRIRNINSAGFEVRFQEWDSLDDIHLVETATFIAMEKGIHQVNETTMAAASCFTVSGLEQFNPITFNQTFTEQPILLTSVTSVNEADAVTLRLQNISTTSFTVALQEQEDNDGVHIEENGCFIAWEQSKGIVDGIMFEASLSGNVITNAEHIQAYNQHFPETPLTLAEMQTANGMDTATLRQRATSIQGISLIVTEEQSADSEISHIEETGGFLALAIYDPAADSDNDGLTNDQEIDIFNTLPGVADSDSDGLEDGSETAYWTEASIGPSADSDQDGLINILDPDSDNDGILDGTEVAAGYDPADASSLQVSLHMETGEVDIDHNAVRVTFSQPFSQPVIIATLITKNDPAPAVVRISKVDASGFTVRIQEYDYLDNIHSIETLSYMVMETGSYTLDNGAQVEAGSFTTNATKSSAPQQLMQPFTINPVILTSVISSNEKDAVTGRIRNISTSGFEYRLQEQESNAKSHTEETVSYIAWEPGSGSHDGISYQVARTSDSVTHQNYQIQYGQSFPNLPILLAGMQTTDGGDTSKLAVVTSTATDLTVFIEEEQSKNSEVKHTKEVAGYIAVTPVL